MNRYAKQAERHTDATTCTTSCSVSSVDTSTRKSSASQHGVVRAVLVAMAMVLTMASAQQANAQACPADNYCYYVPPRLPEISDPGSRNTQDDRVLDISSYLGDATVQIGVPGRLGVSTQLVTDDSVLRIPFAADTELLASNFAVAEERGAYIFSDKPLFVVLRGTAPDEQGGGPESFSASLIRESRVALGTRFRPSGFSMDDDGEGVTSFEGSDMLVVYSPTVATITFTAPAGAPSDYWSNQSGPVHVVTLAAGQTYALRTVRNTTCSPTRELNGALVESSAPIAILSGGRGRSGSCSTAGSFPQECETEGLDHVLPMEQWGNQFILFNYETTQGQGEEVRIIAQSNGTAISLNGLPIGTLAAGETLRTQLSASSNINYLTASGPIGVFQAGGESDCEVDQIFVPPVRFRDGETNLSIPFIVDTEGSYLAVTVPNSSLNELALDGIDVVVNQGGVVQYTTPLRDDLVLLYIPISEGAHRLSSNGDFHMVLASGLGDLGQLVNFSVDQTNTADCLTTFDCDGDEVCDDGVCGAGPECTVTADCSGDLICEAGECVEAPECVTTADCPRGETCEAGQCGPACTTSADCGEFDECINSVCIDPNPGCRLDSECGANLECVNRECVPVGGCTSTSDCQSGEVCADSECVTPEGCTTVADCGAGELCDNGGCVPFCDADSDCAAGEECGAGGTCGPTCGDGTACAAGTVCSDFGTCIECERSSDCDGGEVCNQAGECVASCGSDTDCGGATPNCASDRVCVECQSAADCDAGDICSADGTCETPCSNDNACVGTSNPVCAVEDSTPVCVECLTSADCGADERCSRVNVCVTIGEVPTDGDSRGGACTASPANSDAHVPGGLLLMGLIVAALIPRRRR